MAKKVTSKMVASKASKIMRDGRTSKDSKSVAGSALSQREKSHKNRSREYNPAGPCNVIVSVRNSYRLAILKIR